MIKEESEQINLMSWLMIYNPKAWARTHHSPNGGIRSIVTAVRLKRMGTKRGFPDLVMLVPSGRFNGLALELKVDKNKPTKEQIEWLSFFSECGFHAVSVVGFDAARRVIEKYLTGNSEDI
jgi:hypothetical protein